MVGGRSGGEHDRGDPGILGRLAERVQPGLLPRPVTLDAGEIAVGQLDVAIAFSAKVGDQLFALMVVVDGFDGLLEADGDEQPMTMVAMWMKKSRQVWAGLWGG